MYIPGAMPELPEVETIVRDIRPALLGRRIDRVSLSHEDVLRGVTRRLQENPAGYLLGRERNKEFQP